MALRIGRLKSIKKTRQMFTDLYYKLGFSLERIPTL